RVIRAVAPQMRERRSGTIINLSSVAGVVGMPYAGLYSASKHAVEAIGEALHYELSPFNVRVSIIEPGAFTTSFGDNIVRARRYTADSPYEANAQKFEQSRTKLYPGEPQDPNDVAKAIYEAAYTESPKLRYLVGGDAQMIGAVRKQTDFEGFEKAMRTTLDWWD
ncbi:MAG TPA: SDR family NAD(P)-dependent oxidoreductase, partial [Dehalococcoidia bacterium]